MLLAAIVVLVLSLLSHPLLARSLLERIVVLVLAFIVSLNASLAGRRAARDLSWAILLAGIVYVLLSMVFDAQLALWAGLLVLFSIEAGLSHVAIETSDELAALIPLALIAIGAMGVVFSAPLIPWIVISPFIEYFFPLLVPWGEKGGRLLVVFYYVALYTIVFHIPLVLALYSLALAVLRARIDLLGEPGHSVIDSGARLALVVVAKPWMHVLPV